MRRFLRCFSPDFQRRTVRLSCPVLLLLLTPNFANGQPDSEHPGDSEGGLLETLLPLEADTVQAVERLAKSTDPAATARLLESAGLHQKSDDARLRLWLVRALHQRSRGEQREQVILALLQLLEPSVEGTGAPEASPQIGALKATDEPPSLRHWVRSAAALALARAQHPRAARTLLVLSALGSADDPVGSVLCRQALLAVPPDFAVLRALGNSVPKEVLSAARKSEPAPFEAFDSPRALVSALKDGEALSHTALMSSPSLAPKSYSSKKAWTLALGSSPVWGLRALTPFAKYHSALRAFALTHARKLRGSQDASERSAGAWAVAVLSEEEARAQLSSKDPVIVYATLRQAFTGSLARSIPSNDFSGLAGQAEETKRFAKSASLLTVSLWPSVSEAALRREGNRDTLTGNWLAPLAARIHDDPFLVDSGHRDLREVQGWLKSRSEHFRRATARGLGHATGSSAFGLLLASYEEEPDPSVRSALAAALYLQAARKPSAQRRLAELAELEPDAPTRDFLLGEHLPPFRLVIAQGEPERAVLLQDDFGRNVMAMPAPDGFVAVLFPAPESQELTP